MTNHIIRALRSRRRLLELTQESLGEAIGIDQTRISQWECGRHSPSLDNTLIWAEGLEMEIIAAIRRERK